MHMSFSVFAWPYIVSYTSCVPSLVLKHSRTYLGSLLSSSGQPPLVCYSALQIPSGSVRPDWLLSPQPGDTAVRCLGPTPGSQSRGKLWSETWPSWGSMCFPFRGNSPALPIVWCLKTVVWHIFPPFSSCFQQEIERGPSYSITADELQRCFSLTSLHLVAVVAMWISVSTLTTVYLELILSFLHKM